jgi:hypothetical protein
MSTTPRTAAAVIASVQAVPFEFQEFARQLETELAAMQTRAEIAKAKAAALKKPLLKLTGLWHQLIFLLEITEESDNGTEFRPNRISSCRALDGERIDKIITEAKQIINADVNNQHL